MSDDPLIGRVIAGKYTVETFLGGGAMGAVYRAHQVALDRPVAVKVMRETLASDASFVARFRREALAASRMSHPNLINVSDFGIEPDGLLYLVMEYAPGKALDQALGNGEPMATARIVEIMSQALSALAVAHDAGILHRDLKPENMMLIEGLDDEGNPCETVKVCDFGIASMVGGLREETPDSALPPNSIQASPGRNLTSLGTILGTPTYMSPEQAAGKSLDARSDLYSLGVVLYELLTGQTPFITDSHETMMLRHIQATPVDPTTIVPCDPVLAAICMRALAKNPNERFASARAMRTEIRAVRGVQSNSVTIQTQRRNVAPIADGTLSSSSRPVEAKASKAPLIATALVSILLTSGVAAYVLRVGKSTEIAPSSQTATTVASTVAPSARLETPQPSSAPSNAGVVTDSRDRATGPRNADTPDRAADPRVVAKVDPSAKRVTGSAAQVAEPEPVPQVIATAPTQPEPVATAPVAPAPTAAAPIPAAPTAAAAFAPTTAHVAAAVTKASNGTRGPLAQLVSHISFDACYKDGLRTLGRAEGGSGTARLEIDEDGVIKSVQVSLPSGLAASSGCFASKLRGLRVPAPDTGSASGEVSFTLVPQ